MKFDARFLSSLSLVAALGLGTGCPAEDDPDTSAETDDGTSGDPTTDPTATTTDPTATTTDPTATTTDPTDTTDGTTSDGETTDATDPTEDPTDPTGDDPLPDGSDCTMSEQCESGSCYVTGIGGLCGECAGDDDCDGGGCSLPNPLATPPEGSVCNAGELGDGCQTTDVCGDGLQCVEIINVPGILMASTCSECETTADCDGELVCNVSVDVANISGQQTCVAVDSVPDGEFCDLEGDGALACTNFCAEASVKGLLTFGLCGECAVDGDCADGLSCVEPEVGIDGTVVASFCE